MGDEGADVVQCPFNLLHSINKMQHFYAESRINSIAIHLIEIRHVSPVFVSLLLLID